MRSTPTTLSPQAHVEVDNIVSSTAAGRIAARAARVTAGGTMVIGTVVVGTAVLGTAVFGTVVRRTVVIVIAAGDAKESS